MSLTLSDPWRYVCPRCESHRTTKRTTYNQETVKGGRDAAGPYYCRACNQNVPGLKDKKTGEIES